MVKKMSLNLFSILIIIFISIGLGNIISVNKYIYEHKNKINISNELRNNIKESNENKRILFKAKKSIKSSKTLPLPKATDNITFENL